MAIGSLASAFNLRSGASAVMMWSWVYTAYANWFACLLGGITGASRMTPIAGVGTVGSSLAEGVVSFLLVSLAIAAIIGTSLAVWGFRKGEIVSAAKPVTTGVVPSSL